MVDNLNPESGDLGRSQPAAAGRVRPVIGESDEREIALGGTDAPPPAIVHQWLDGEASETTARRAATRDAELWSRINEETARRGRMTTPAPVLNRLMAAIPDTAPTPAVAVAPKPFFERQFSLGAPAIAAASAGLLAVGAVIGAILF